MSVPDPRSTARSTLARVLFAGSSRLFRLGNQVSGTQPRQDSSGPDSSRRPQRKYGRLWVPKDEEAARLAIATDDDPERFERTGIEEVEARIAPFIDKESTVVDLGCGIGRLALHAAPRCKTLWAVDASETMLQMARHRLSGLGNVHFALCMDTEIPAIEDGSVDFVYSIIVLQHLEKEDAYLLMKEVLRLLKPGGTAVLTFPNILDDEYFVAFLECAESGRSCIDNAAKPRFWVLPEVERVVRAAGFAAVEVWDGPNMTAVCSKG